MAEPIILSSGVVDARFGERVKIVQPVNVYGCEIGDDCFIGPFVEIQRSVRIGKRCRIQSHAFVCELVTIGDDTFIGHGVMFINDVFAKGGPARGDKTLWRSTHIGREVSIGSNATVLPVTICDGAVVGAGSVVTRDIPAGVVAVGNPCRVVRAIRAER
jgi:acetyltransferase-like isoleucine patch superfamily enzyme